MIFFNRKFLIFWFLTVLIIVSSASRFNTMSFVFSRNLSLYNISPTWNYFDINKTELNNLKFIGYSIDDEFNNKFKIENKFFHDLFSSDFFLLNEFGDYSRSLLLSNFNPKFERKSRFIQSYYYNINSSGGIYFLFVNENLPDESRYYYKVSPLKSLRSFHLNKLKNSKKNDLIILFTDVSYYNFRQICDNIEFVDVIINLQDFESGRIYDKKIYNVSTEENIIDRFDILFGKNGYLSISNTKIELDKIDNSTFIDRFIKARSNINENID